jgi:hypothetical protein
VNVAALRQHITPDERVHGIFTEAGEKPNIVPRQSAAQWFVRSPTADGLEALKRRVLGCLQAGADASGCTMHTRVGRPPLPRRPRQRGDDGGVRRQRRHPRPDDGRPSRPGRPPRGGQHRHGQRVVPHPEHPPDAAGGTPGVAIHTADFAEHARGPLADRAVLDGAKAMAMTAVDLWCTPLLEAARAGFTRPG